MCVLAVIAATAQPDWTWLTQAGSVGILAAIVIAFMKGWIVSGTQYDELRQQRDKALEQVFKLADAAQRTIEAAERRIAP
jgi:hypothetical protein